MNIKRYFIALLLLTCSLQLFSYDWQKEERWDWSNIDKIDNQTFWQNLTEYFPKDFAWGVATSAFQIEGTQSANGQHCRNSWTMHKNLPQPGISTGHWDRYKEDVQLIKSLGLKYYRFSIEWSKIEPKCGVFDMDAMQHYIDLVDELIANGITPIPCLFHHAWPVWFDKKGHFEDKKNIQYFVEFAHYVFEKLQDKVSMWMTFNEPAGYAMAAYVDGKYPPCKKYAFRQCGFWLKHVLYAHVEAAMLFKKINPNVQIGFPMMFNPLDPYNSSNPLDYKITQAMNYLLHDATLNFFKTGHFKWGFFVRGYHEDAPKSLDYLGVNYYSHTNIGWFQRKHRKNEPLTGNAKNGRTIYPEGLYRSLKKAHELTSVLNIPIYVAENGVNDGDDIWKNEFLKKHLVAIKEAMEEGITIAGYFWWTLMDSFSWSKNQDSKMGFYRVDENLNRIKRTGIDPFLNFIKFVQKQH
jgi:beta-glucosidase